MDLKQETYKGYTIYFTNYGFNGIEKDISVSIKKPNLEMFENNGESYTSKAQALEITKSYIDRLVPNIKTSFKIYDEVKVNMKIVEKHDNMPPYLKLVRKVIKEGDGKPYINSFEGDKAYISGNKFGFGGVFVPINSLIK